MDALQQEQEELQETNVRVIATLYLLIRSPFSKLGKERKTKIDVKKEYAGGVIVKANKAARISSYDA
jgi:hypothetical protein